MLASRPPAVAGLFYPDNPEELSALVSDLLDRIDEPAATPKALIAPHAGYVYSGPVAASAYAALKPVAGKISKVVLLGPSHRVSFQGLALSSAQDYGTPLGPIPVDAGLQRIALDVPGVRILDSAHAMEHSLEVHLPFLQTVLGEFSLLPVVVGQAEADRVAALLRAVWGGAETLIVISTDLSHYLPYEAAQRIDRRTAQAIERAEYRRIDPQAACGCYPLRGLLRLAEDRHMQITTLDLRNSGDTAGTRDRVVGYGSYALYEPH